MNAQGAVARKLNSDPSPEDKFGCIAKAIHWAYEVTRFPSLPAVQVDAGPGGIVLSGEVDTHIEQWWSELLAKQYSRGLSVTCQVRVKSSDRSDGPDDVGPRRT